MPVSNSPSLSSDSGSTARPNSSTFSTSSSSSQSPNPSSTSTSASGDSSFVFASSRYSSSDSKKPFRLNLSHALRNRHAIGAVDVKYSTLPFSIGTGGFIALPSHSPLLLSPVAPSPNTRPNDYFSHAGASASSASVSSRSPLSPASISSRGSSVVASSAAASPSYPSIFTTHGHDRSSPSHGLAHIRAQDPTVAPPTPAIDSGFIPPPRARRAHVAPDPNTFFPRELDESLVELIRRSKHRRVIIEGAQNELRSPVAICVSETDLKTSVGGQDGMETAVPSGMVAAEDFIGHPEDDLKGENSSKRRDEAHVSDAPSRKFFTSSLSFSFRSHSIHISFSTWQQRRNKISFP